MVPMTATGPTAVSSHTSVPSGAPPVPLTVEVTATVGVEETVDMVALFASMGELARKRYFALDTREFSIAAEWERPLAYVWPDATDLVPLSMAPGAVSHPRGDINDADVRVVKRNGEHPVGYGMRWCEADYTRLAALVPWLGTHVGVPHEVREDTANVLVVEVSAEIGVEETIPLADLFNAMSAQDRRQFFDLNLSEAGMDSEWERPLAYLWPDADDLIPYTMVPGTVSHPRGVVEEADVRVSKRNGVRAVGHARGWTEDDYQVLAGHVAWLKRHAFEQEMNEHERARMPGPLDVPLFG